MESSGGTRGFEFLVQGASKVPVVTGPYKLFVVCRVYIQGRDINIIEIQIIKYGKTKQKELVFELKLTLLFLKLRP